MDSMGDVFYLTLILCIFLFMFSVLGQSLFGASWDDVDNPDGNWTFSKGFWYSLLVVFQIITGDAWNSVMVR